MKAEHAIIGVCKKLGILKGVSIVVRKYMSLCGGTEAVAYRVQEVVVRVVEFLGTLVKKCPLSLGEKCHLFPKWRLKKEMYHGIRESIGPKKRTKTIASGKGMLWDTMHFTIGLSEGLVILKNVQIALLATKIKSITGLISLVNTIGTLTIGNDYV